MSLDDIYEIITNPEIAIKKGGFIALLSIVFAENGIIIGVILPGDHLLFTAGLLCATGFLDVGIGTLLFSVWSAATLGTLFGYLTGKKLGKPFFQKEGMIIKHKHIVQTRAYFFRFGGKTIAVSKFLPWVRTLAPLLAGTVEMPFRRFMTYNVIGSVIWVGSLVGGGYWLGYIYGEEILEYLPYFIILFIVLATGAVVVSYLKGKAKRKLKLATRNQRK